MKDAKEARQIGADVTLIKSKFFHGVRGGPKQGGVSGTLIFAHKGAQVLWHRKGEKKVVSGELAVDLFFEPLSSLMLLASRAMAIATGAIELMGLSAAFALVVGNATDFSATGGDSIDSFAVCFRHAVGVAFEILRGEGAKDLIDGGHG